MSTLFGIIVIFILTNIGAYCFGHDIGYKRGYREGAIDEQHNQRTP